MNRPPSRALPFAASLALLLAASAALSACDVVEQDDGPATADDGTPATEVGSAGYITGMVAGPDGPEAGVWVIAETDDLPTRFARIVVRAAT